MFIGTPSEQQIVFSGDNNMPRTDGNVDHALAQKSFDVFGKSETLD
jgi:hypothetical protein